MYARSAACAVLLAVTVATAGCSSAADGEAAQPTESIGTAPELYDAAWRRTCIDAWADVILAHPRDWDPSEEETPEKCWGHMSASTGMDLYLFGKEKAENERLKLPPIDDGASLTAEESTPKSEQP
ncbi:MULTISPECIES: hypothetical protein [unclassified Streptomyces]|uniref:hypothetical protein n=1 Tax=unclassified Streptomyces TaxID=2593676 RepID=UPI0036A83C2F